MMKTVRLLSALFVFCALSVQTSLSYDKAEIYYAKLKMIQESRLFYFFLCPCPYDTAVNGSSCILNSIYKPGGAEPFCYESDITDAQAAEWLRRNKR